MREDFMREALAEARRSGEAGEIPVGAVVVSGGEIVARAHNERESSLDPTAHAEVLALRRAAKRLGRRRLAGCELYVTLEPCPMCAGAILNARIPRVYYGARDEAMGACGGVFNLYMERFAHTPALVGGVLEADCRAALEEFFRTLRKT